MTLYNTIDNKHIICSIIFPMHCDSLKNIKYKILLGTPEVHIVLINRNELKGLHNHFEFRTQTEIIFRKEKGPTQYRIIPIEN